MIGGDHVDEPFRQGFPKGIDVSPRSQGRRGDPVVAVLFLKHMVDQQQVLLEILHPCEDTDHTTVQDF